MTRKHQLRLFELVLVRKSHAVHTQWNPKGLSTYLEGATITGEVSRILPHSLPNMESTLHAQGQTSATQTSAATVCRKTFAPLRARCSPLHAQGQTSAPQTSAGTVCRETLASPPRLLLHSMHQDRQAQHRQAQARCAIRRLPPLGDTSFITASLVRSGSW